MFRSRYVCGPSGQEDTGHGIPLLPELEQSFTAIVGSSDLGMEGIRRAMLASDSLEDTPGILHSPLRDDPSLHYEAESMQLSDTADLCRMTQLKLQSTSDPILLDRHLGDDPHDHEVMYTDLTNHYREFSPGSTGDCGLEPELSDSSSEGSGLESPSSAVQWDTIAECAIDTEGPLPPVSDIFTHRISKQEEYGDPLYPQRSLSLPFLIKTERTDSEEDSLDCSLLSKHPSPLLSYATLQPHLPYLPHTLTSSPALPTPTPTTNGCVNNAPVAPTITTTTTTTTNNSNYHDYTSTPREERPNCRRDEHSAKLGHFGNGSSAEGEKAQRKKPGRKKGQVSKVLHLWEFIRDLLGDPNYCPRIINWENETEGVFRVLQSSEVARLWGEKKKNKKTMTYEKLSRSLRYSRKEGYFDDLPRDRGYPKKLCFKFGPKSHGWREYQR